MNNLNQFGMHKRRYIVAVIGVTLVTVVSFSLALIQTSDMVYAKQTPVGRNSKVVQSQSLPGSFADLVAAIKPAVVNISTTGRGRSGQFQMPQFQFPEGSPFEEFFRHYFEGPNRQPRDPNRGQQLPKTKALGSGFIIDPSGYVVTNNHVIDNAAEITVILDDGTQLSANLKGRDQKTDLALLKVEADKPLPYVEFGDSDSSRVGDWVIAIGNPFGLGGSTTTGIISARGRDIQSGPLDDFIQVDAPINRGNSGGPLFNTKGNVIGINTAIYSPNGGSVGIGFAIPSALAKPVIEQLREHGKATHGWLGVQIQVVSEEIADSLGLKKASGALVARVVKDSPAEAAGLQVGDVVLEFDGKEVAKMKELPRIVAATKADKKVDIVVWRDNERKTLKVKVGSGPDAEPVADSGSDQAPDQKAKLGLTLSTLTAEIRRNYRIDKKVNGVVVTAIEPGSPSAQKGIRVGDVIKRIGQTKVSTPQEAIDAFDKASSPVILLLVSRRGNDRFVTLKAS